MQDPGGPHDGENIDQRPTNKPKRPGHTVAESMDSTLRGFLGSNTSKAGGDAASRRSRSRGSWLSGTWPPHLADLEVPEGNPVNPIDPGGEEKNGGGDMLLDSGNNFNNLSILLEPSWKSPTQEKKAFFGSGPSSPVGPVVEVGGALEGTDERKKTHGKQRSQTSLFREQMNEDFVDATFASPKERILDKKDWQTDQEQSKKTQQLKKGPPKEAMEVPRTVRHQKVPSTKTIPPLSPKKPVEPSAGNAVSLQQQIVQQKRATSRKPQNPLAVPNPLTVQDISTQEKYLVVEQQRLHHKQQKLNAAQEALQKKQDLLNQLALSQQQHMQRLNAAAAAAAPQDVSQLSEEQKQQRLQIVAQQQQLRVQQQQQQQQQQRHLLDVQLFQQQQHQLLAQQRRLQQQLLHHQRHPQSFKASFQRQQQSLLQHFPVPPHTATQPQNRGSMDQALPLAPPVSPSNHPVRSASFPTANNEVPFRFPASSQVPTAGFSAGVPSSFGTTQSTHMSTSSHQSSFALGQWEDSFQKGTDDDDMSPRTRKKNREKERRQLLNQHYDTLLNLLKPRSHNARRPEKTTILEETIQMMRTLMRTNSVLEQRNKEMQTELANLKGEGKAGGAPQQQAHEIKRSLSPTIKEMSERGIKIEPIAGVKGETSAALKGAGVVSGGQMELHDAAMGTESPSEGIRQRLENVTVEQQDFASAR